MTWQYRRGAEHHVCSYISWQAGIWNLESGIWNLESRRPGLVNGTSSVFFSWRVRTFKCLCAWIQQAVHVIGSLHLLPSSPCRLTDIRLHLPALAVTD